MISKKEKNALNSLINICEMEQERNYASMSRFFDDLFTVFHNFKDTQIPQFVETAYTGIHINDTYEENDFHKMIEQFRNNKILHAKYALKIVNDALRKHKNFSNISHCNLVASTLPAHGSFKDLYYIIDKYGIPGKNYGFVFNGDFVDRGSQQCEVLLTLLFAFLLFPNRVFLNRGNHEDLSLNLSNHFVPNFNSDCSRKFGQYGNEFFKQSQELFKYLPIATFVTNKAGYKCFIIHGGISERVDLEFVSSDEMNRSDFSSITIRDDYSSSKRKQAEQFCDLLWSDPMRKDSKPYYSKVGCHFNSNRGIGYLFGEDVSEKFCKKNKLNVIIRSHEVRQDGYSKDHPYCWTVFSCSNYCNGTNSAAVLILNQNNDYLKIHVFKTKELDNDSFLKQKDFILATFKTYLENNFDYLNSRFEKIDTKKTGWIKIEEWANVICDLIANNSHYPPIAPKHLIELKDNLLPCDDQHKLAKYTEMFKQSVKSSARHLTHLLDSIFSMIDSDHSGTISKSEAAEAVKQINTLLGTCYTLDFMTNMDQNSDGLIDYQEFKNGFSTTFGLI